MSRVMFQFKYRTLLQHLRPRNDMLAGGALHTWIHEEGERLIQGRAKKILLSSVAHVPSGLIGCALAA